MFSCCVNNNPVIEPGRRPGPSGSERNPLQSSENREQVFQKLAQNRNEKIFYDNRGDLVAATTGVETINIQSFTGPVKVYQSSSISAETYRETVKYKERGRVKYQALLFDGELKNGEYKEGTLYEDNKSFTGCFKDEKPDGEVTVVTTGKDGQTTTSVETWKNGVVWTGNGSLRNPEIKIPYAFDGSKASEWEGNIKDGKPSGKGALTLSKSVELSSSLRGFVRDYATQKILIKGNVHNGVFDKDVTITCSGDLTFDATFTNGQLISGQGTFVSARSEDARKGVRYESDNNNVITFNTQGLISGDSVIQTTDHEIYEGPIENGERNGLGKLTITKNNRVLCKIEGKWKAGVIQDATLTVGSSTFDLTKSKGDGSYTISATINGEALDATVCLGPQRSALYNWLEQIKKDGLEVKLYRPENNSRTLVYEGTFSVEHGIRLSGKDVDFATPKREGTSQSGNPRKAEYINGEIVKGEFIKDGKLVYTGHIKGGAPHGPGILHNWSDGKDIETYFVRGRMTRRYYVLNNNKERIAVTSYNKMDDRNLCLQNKDKDRTGFLEDLAGSRKDLNEYEFSNKEDYLDNFPCAVQPPLLDTDPNRHPINRY